MILQQQVKGWLLLHRGITLQTHACLLYHALCPGGDNKTSVWDVSTWKEVMTGRGKPFAKHPVSSIVYSGRAGANGLATPPLLIASDEGPAIWGM